MIELSVFNIWQHYQVMIDHAKVTKMKTEVEHVRQDVTVEVRPGNCVGEMSITALRILAKLGQKLRGDEWELVARPFFP